MSGERRCQRCGDEEFRIDGYCTEYCKDMHGVERERDEARAEVAHLRRGIEAYREAYQELSERCRGGCSCRLHAWEAEDKKRREVEEEQRRHHTGDVLAGAPCEWATICTGPRETNDFEEGRDER